MLLLKKGMSAAALVSAVLLAGCNKPPTSQHEKTVVDDGAKVRAECIREARWRGYRAGNCAYDFIQKCINTQSRSAMDSMMQVDTQLGTRYASSCPNSSDLYSAEFDKF